jgi:hypothetical protein
MALLQRLTEPEPIAVPRAAPHIRRCTYRRLSRVEAAGQDDYDVSCMYPDRRVPLPLGDLLSSAAVCTSCMADHVFRPDED